MNLEAIVTGAFEEICYLAWNSKNQALIFDPGFDADLIDQTLEGHELDVVAYICTHGHADHINALAELHRHRPAPIAMHTNDQAWAFESINQMPPHYPVPPRPEVKEIHALETATDWTFANLHFQCIETPGHTPGSCCILFPETNILISGDTLFKGSCGRTDLPGGDARQLRQSLNKLKQLPAETRVYPGHGPDTTIETERATNYFMQ